MSTEPPSGSPGFWTRDRVARVLRDLSDVNLPQGSDAFTRIWTDTRTVGKGDLFVAIEGERFDGHEFLSDAIANGAAGVVVSRPVKALGVPVYGVADTLVALGALAAYRRSAWGKMVIAVAGSNGKTSTKELIRAALGSRLEVYATRGNLNNLVGVPLTLLALPDSADVAVVEIGTNQPGEVARLREIVRPDVAVITSVGEEHLEGLGDLAGVLREELSACDSVGVAIVPASQPEVVEEARQRAERVVAAGLDGDGIALEGRQSADGPDSVALASSHSVDATGGGMLSFGGIDVRVPLKGIHNLRNAMLALAVGRELGLSAGESAEGIAGMSALPMRVSVEQIGGLTVINDAYNANPGSMRAALELLAGTAGWASRQRVAVLGSMLELGGQSEVLHDRILGDALALPIDLVVGVGEFAHAMGRLAVSGTGAADDPRVVRAADVESLWDGISTRVRSDAVILLKGSRGMGLERVLTHIQ